MAKELKRLKVIISDTSAPGSPDSVNYEYIVTDSDDSALIKSGAGTVESPDLTKTCTEMYTEIETTVKTAEGIS